MTKQKTILFSITALSLTLAVLIAFQPLQSTQTAFADQPSIVNQNQPLSKTSNGVKLELSVPTTVYANQLTEIKMKVSDDKSKAPLSHVDWAIDVKDPLGYTIYKTTTAHSHAGEMDFAYSFWQAGTYTISLTTSSIGPKMMGMDVPPMARTHSVLSGDVMMGFKKDPENDFGARTFEFPIFVQQEKQAHTINGSQPGTSINVEMTENAPRVVAGQPVTLVFTVTNGKDGSMVTHPDMQLAIKQGKYISSESAPPGGMMAMNGAYHGHMGVISVTTVFPLSGHYIINADVNSLPVSNLNFGKASTQFELHVYEPTENVVSSTALASASTQVPNTVNILGIESPFFTPNSINIKAGTTVTFVNTDGNIHTVTSVAGGTQNPDGTFDSGLIKPGQTFTYTFEKPGTYNYICTIHPHMHGTVIVS
jgi:plastocyanin